MHPLIGMANNLGQKIKESAEFAAYENSRASYDGDGGLQRQIGEYNLKRQTLIQENGKDEAERDVELQESLQKEMRELYAAIMENENMKSYVETKKTLDGLIGEIFNTLNIYINGQQDGCGGSCSSCAGCQ